MSTTTGVRAGVGREATPGNVSVLFPAQPVDPRVVVPFADLARSVSPSVRTWLGHSMMVDSLDTFSFLAGAGHRQPFGTSVSLMASRHPFDAAVRARSVAIASGSPFVAGFGTSVPRFVAAMRGVAWESPLTAAREFLDVVRGLLGGGHVSVSGRYFQVAGALSPVPFDVPRVELGLGVLRPGMARLAGEVADVAITWMTPPGYIADTIVPALDEGAARAGRPRPRLVAVVHAALGRPGRHLPDTVFAGASAHLSAPHYCDMLRRAGIPVAADDPHAGAGLLLEHGVFASGSPRDIAETIASYRRSGVDEVVVNPAGVMFSEGPERAVDELAAILGAVSGGDT